LFALTEHDVQFTLQALHVKLEVSPYVVAGQLAESTHLDPAL